MEKGNPSFLVMTGRCLLPSETVMCLLVNKC